MEAVVYRNKSAAVVRVIVKSIPIGMTPREDSSVISIAARDMPHN